MVYYSCCIPHGKPLLNHQRRFLCLTQAKRTGLLLSGLSLISLGNQGPRVCSKNGEAQNPSCLKSSVKFPQTVMIQGAMSSSAVGPLCFSPKSMQPSTRKFQSTSCFLLLTSFMKMPISFSSRTWHLSTLPKVPIPSLMTIGIPCLIGQQTDLVRTPQKIDGVLSRGS